MDIVTLIPAYKPKYLPELLNALRVQSRPPGQILFSDDSPGGEYSAALRSDAMSPLRDGMNIEIHEGPRQGGYANVMHLVNLWKGRSRLLHILFDDDIPYPEFYERHLAAHASGTFSCSISRRWTANEQGQPLLGQWAPPVVAFNQNRMLSLDDGVVFMTTVTEGKNWFGEFSNAVFNAAAAEVLLKPEFDGVSYAGLWDLGAFLAASLRAPICHLQDYLGYFRIGALGNSSNFFGPYMKAAYLGYAALAVGASRIGKYTPVQAQNCFLLLGPAIAQRYGSQPDMLPFVELLPKMAAGDEQAVAAFVQVWHAFLREHGF